VTSNRRSDFRGSTIDLTWAIVRKRIFGHLRFAQNNGFATAGRDDEIGMKTVFSVPVGPITSSAILLPSFHDNRIVRPQRHEGRFFCILAIAETTVGGNAGELEILNASKSQTVAFGRLGCGAASVGAELPR